MENVAAVSNRKNFWVCFFITTCLLNHGYGSAYFSVTFGQVNFLDYMKLAGTDAASNVESLIGAMSGLNMVSRSFSMPRDRPFAHCPRSSGWWRFRRANSVLGYGHLGQESRISLLRRSIHHWTHNVCCRSERWHVYYVPLFRWRGYFCNLHCR